METKEKIELKVILPKIKIKSTSQNPRNLILYSPPKTGKTTLVSLLPDCLILDFEKGSSFIDAMKLTIVGLRGKEDETEQEKEERYKNKEYSLDEVGRAIIKEGKPYKYIAIDTITEFEKWMEDEGTKLYMESPIGKNFNRRIDGKVDYKNYRSVLTLANGAGYMWLREAFNIWISKINILANHIILLGHVKDKVIEKGGKEVNAKDLDLTGKLRSISCAKSDAVGYMYRDGKKVIVTFNTSDEVTCGSRCKHLLGKEIDFAESDDDGNIIRCDWNKIFIE